MSYHTNPYKPHAKEDDGNYVPAINRGLQAYPVGPFTSLSMPGANDTSQLNDPLGNLIEEPDASEYPHDDCNSAPVTGRQQGFGGQPPQHASLVPPHAFPDPHHPHATASTAQPRFHHSHVHGSQPDLSHAQAGWYGHVRPPLPQGGPRAQGEIPESHRSWDGSKRLPANMPYLGHRSINIARQDDRFPMHHAHGSANDGMGDVYSSKGDSIRRPESMDPPMMPFDGNATMNVGNTTPSGDPGGSFMGNLSQETNATLQTPRVNTGHELLGFPRYNQSGFRGPLRASTQTHPVHHQPQPWHPIAAEGSLNTDGRHRGLTSAYTYDQPLRRQSGMAPNNDAPTLTHHSGYETRPHADQRSKMHTLLRTMPSPSGLLQSLDRDVMDQNDGASGEAGYTLQPELATSDVIDPHLPASRGINNPRATKSNVTPCPRPTKRKRSRSSPPLQEVQPRKGRKLAPLSDYEKKRRAHVRKNGLACNHCKAHRIVCTHWDDQSFRSQYWASDAPNTPTSHATATETRRAVRRPHSSAGTRALAPSPHLETIQTSSSPTLVEDSGETNQWGNTVPQIWEQVDYSVGLTSPLSAATVPQGPSGYQGPAYFDTMTNTISEAMHSPDHLMQSSFMEGETPSQETVLRETGMQFGSDANNAQMFPTSHFLPELDEVSESQQYLDDFRRLSLASTNPNDDWDPPPPS